jgi:hypothetical protein
MFHSNLIKKLNMKTIKNITAGIVILLFFAACNPLDKENLAALTADDMWSNPSVATGYVNDIYALLMPASFNTGRTTDETMVVNSEYAAVLSDYLRGTITNNTYNDFPYETIRKINIFIAGVDEATFDDATKKSLKAQVQFWRAWAYFRMVKAYGGVPLAIEPVPPDATDEEIFLPRAKTSECIAQIIKDLDEAIVNLPDKSTDGHIDKCSAKAFKGRVLMYYASPQFNRTNDVARWTTAYNANKEARDFCVAQGKGLYPAFKEIWHAEMSQEVIMVKRYQYPSYANGYSQACMRPLLYARGCVGSNYPSLELVNAFPMKDGSKYDPNTMDYGTLYRDRDDRFYATIAYNGAPPFISPMFGNENMWIYWYDSDGDPNTGINGNEARSDNNSPFGSWAENLYCHGGFYPAKMLDRNITRTTVEDGQVDWIEIRFAEVLMNLAECANEKGNTTEALEILYQIRDRAGIEPGTGNYGITATDVAGIRKVIQDERFVEFAFEAQRFWDLRRWRIYKSTFETFADHRFHGLRYDYNGSIATRPGGLTPIDVVYDQFEVSVILDTRDITFNALT